MSILTDDGWTRALTPILLVALAMCGCGDGGSSESGSPMATAPHEGGSNEPPTVQVRIEPAQPAQGDRARAVASVRDVEGDETTLSYRWSVNGMEVAENGEVLDLADVRPGSDIEVSVSANDGYAESEPATAAARVIDKMPVINGLAIAPPKTVHPGDRIVVTPTATDPEGSVLDFEFTWLVNDEPVRNEGDDERAFSAEGLSQGDRVRVRVVANDGLNDSLPVESADVIVGSAHPEIVSSPPQMNDEGVFRYQVEATDPDGDRRLRYRLAEAPDGMRIDASGLVEWKPGREQVGAHPVSIVVRDSTRLETTQSFEVTVGSTEAAPPASLE